MRLTQQSLTIVLASMMLFACAASGKTPPAANDDSSAPVISVPRIVAIGDVHGDYDQFVKLLQVSGLINKRNKWIGGDAHLVQLGDIPDRGPDTRKTMDLLIKLEKSAARKGGAVTVLIGNHEAMNMIGDLRYVHPGEYKAFVDRNSKARQQAYYEQTKAWLRANLPVDELPTFDVDHKVAWKKKYPLGYAEHRLAWAPAGKYGKWVLSRPAVAVVGDSLFVHGGIAPEYQAMPVTEINTRVRTALAMGESLAEGSIVDDPNGPLWYRGWVTAPASDQSLTALQSVLDAYGVKRMVVAHTPVLPIVLPRFGGRFVIIDVGLSEAYGRGFSALEIVEGQARAIFGERRLLLPDEPGMEALNAYLLAAQPFASNPEKVANYREKFVTPALLQAANSDNHTPDEQAETGAEPAAASN